MQHWTLPVALNFHSEAYKLGMAVPEKYFSMLLMVVDCKVSQKIRSISMLSCNNFSA